MYTSANALLKGIKLDFAKRMASNEQSAYTPFVFQAKSTGAYETYLLFDAVPYPKEWKDKIDNSIIKDYSFTIQNKDWARGIRVDRNFFDDVKSELGGSIELQIKSMADNWVDFPDDLVNDLITNNGTAFDGSTFFANSHNISGGANIDNLYAGTGITLAQITADYSGLRTTMSAYKDEYGNPYNRNPKWAVLIPPQLQDLFLTLKNSQQVYDGSGNKTNIYQNTFEIIVNQRQDTTNNDWYLINTNAVIPAFIVQTRLAPEWLPVEDVPSNKYIDYNARSRMNAGYGNFCAIAKVDNS